MNKGDKVYVSKDGIYWYDAIFETHSSNGYFYVKGYDRGLSYCKSELEENDIYKGEFNHYELFFC